MLLGVCLGLAELHECDVIHHDLATHNVMVSDSSHMVALCNAVVYMWISKSIHHILAYDLMHSCTKVEIANNQKFTVKVSDWWFNDSIFQSYYQQFGTCPHVRCGSAQKKRQFDTA